MGNSVWKGFVQLGLLNIPVALKTAARAKRVETHNYHVACNSPVQQPKWCGKCNVKLAPTEIYKGYEVGKGIVQLTEEELEGITPATEKTMEITECVELAAIDPAYLAESFYVLPDEGGQKAYSLMVEALRQSNRVAITKLTKSGRENVGILRPKGHGLMLHYLWFADELSRVPEFEELKPASNISAQETKLAKQLVESLDAPFHVEQFEDGYRQRLNTLIASKLDSAVAAPTPIKATAQSQTVDIAAALQASLLNRPKRKVTVADEPPAAPAPKSKKGKKAA